MMGVVVGARVASGVVVGARVASDVVVGTRVASGVVVGAAVPHSPQCFRQWVWAMLAAIDAVSVQKLYLSNSAQLKPTSSQHPVQGPCAA